MVQQAAKMPCNLDWILAPHKVVKRTVRNMAECEPKIANKQKAKEYSNTYSTGVDVL